jgi:transposase
MVLELQSITASQWEAVMSVVSKLGCTPESLRRWIRQIEIDTGSRAGLSSDERQRLKDLEKENKQLKKANEILRIASAFFARGCIGEQAA